MEDHTSAQIAPSGDFGNTLERSIAARPARRGRTRPASAIRCCRPSSAPSSATPRTCSTPAASRRQLAGAQRAQVFIDPTTGLPYTRGYAQILRRNVEGGGRAATIRSTRAIASSRGLRGDLSDVWSYDAYYQFGQTEFRRDYLNDFSVTRLTRALDVIDDPRTPGVDPICRSVAQRHRPDLHPLRHLRHRPGDAGLGGARLSADAGLPARHQQADRRQRLDHRQSRRLGHQIPWAQAGSAVAMGVEYRRESARLLDRRRLLVAAVERSRRPGRADAAGRRRASTSARPSPRSGCRSSRTASSTSSRSRPAIAIPIIDSVPGASAPTPTGSASNFAPVRDFRIRASLQPRRPRAEHPGAVRAAARRARRQWRSLRRAGTRSPRSPPVRRWA